MYRKLYVLLPSLVSFLVALVTCLPWGAPVSVAFSLPLVTMGVIFYWSVKRPDLVPSPGVFLIGLFSDLATAGPLGYWSLNFLIANAIAGYSFDRFGNRREPASVLISFVCTVFAVSLLGWILSSLFFMRPTPVRPLVLGAAIAVTAYPLIALMFAPIDRAIGRALLADGLRLDEYA